MFELENRGQRSHVIGLADHVSGGEVKVDGSGKPGTDRLIHRCGG